jgi:alanine racemase
MLYQTYAKVHLQNIQHNIERIRAFLGKDTRLLLAAKADGYGHNAVAVAAMAERCGLVDWIGIATVPEGMALRRGGVRLPILKFSPAFPEEMEAALDADLTLAVCEDTNIRQLQVLSRRRRVRARVHLKIDTGMRRLGVEPEEALRLACCIEEECPNLNLEGVFTHLPVGDQRRRSGFTQRQIVCFESCVDDLSRILRRPPWLRHCASSGAILEHPASRMNMVRAGTLAYGYYPMGYPGQPLELLPGLSLATRVSFLKRIKKGTPVGYGLTWKAEEDVWIATIPIGYADGLDRRLSNRGRVLIKGRFHGIVGRICMDQATVCLGPEADVSVGDEVVLLGRSGDEEITIYEIARLLRTIPCEFTARLGSRVPRLIESA